MINNMIIVFKLISFNQKDRIIASYVLKTIGYRLLKKCCFMFEKKKKKKIRKRLKERP